MGDPRKLAYLEALGVEAYVPRRGRPVDVAATVATAATDADPTAPASVASLGTVADLDWDSLRARVAACTRCELHATRTQTVFGVGNPRARWMFIGEAPGAEEDKQGEPFVGRAGQLLNEILKAVHFTRDEVYICNILKCRPPNNRDPLPSEVEQCEPYLHHQLRILQPKIILALGRIAAQTLLRTNDSLTKLRAGEHTYQGIPLMVTYHPAALLRNPNWKRPTWEDVQKFRARYDAIVGAS